MFVKVLSKMISPWGVNQLYLTGVSTHFSHGQSYKVQMRETQKRKPVFLSELFKKGILSIKHLLNGSGILFLIFQESRD